MNTKFFTVSELTHKQHEAQWTHVLHFATHPDKGSTFARLTSFLRLLPKRLLFFLLVPCLKYDGIICYDEGKFIGHVFFQKHRFHWGIFSVFVQEEYRAKGYAKHMLAECLKRAYALLHIQRVYLGNGGDPCVQHIVDLATTGKLGGLKFSLKPGTRTGEIVLSRPTQDGPVRHLLAGSVRKI